MISWTSLILWFIFSAGNFSQINLANNKLTNFQSSVFQSVLISVAGYNNNNNNYYVSISGSKKKRTFRCS